LGENYGSKKVLRTKAKAPQDDGSKKVLRTKSEAPQDAEIEKESEKSLALFPFDGLRCCCSLFAPDVFRYN
jgi:hypothetical protein